MSEIERESDFAAMVQERGIMDWLTDSAPETTPDTQEAPASQPRDASGRFASAAQDAEVSAEEEIPADAGTESDAEEPEAEEVSDDSTEEGQETEEGDIVLEIEDPEILALLDKYDGDLIKALKAATEAQSLIGRQGQELGELRKLQESQDQIRQEMERLRLTQSYDWESLIEEDPETAARMAVEIRDPMLLQRSVEAWGENNPFQAMMFMNELAQAAAEEASSQPQDISTEVAALQERYPDLVASLPAIEKLAAERPVLRQALEIGDPRSRTQALEDLYLLAKTQTNASETSTRARKIVLQAKAEADAAVADAAVVSATNTTVETPPPSGADQFRSWFRQATGQPDEE